MELHEQEWSNSGLITLASTHPDHKWRHDPVDARVESAQKIYSTCWELWFHREVLVIRFKTACFGCTYLCRGAPGVENGEIYMTLWLTCMNKCVCSSSAMCTFCRLGKLGLTNFPGRDNVSNRLIKTRILVLLRTAFYDGMKCVRWMFMWKKLSFFWWIATASAFFPK